MSRGYHVRHVIPAAENRSLPGGVFHGNLTTDEAVQQLHRSITGREGVIVGGLIHLSDLTSAGTAAGAGSPDQATRDLTGIFRLVQTLLPNLIAAAEEGSGWVLNVTALDGMFGCQPQANSPLNFASAGSVGMFKSLAREQSRLSVKNVDLAAELLAAERLPETAERLVDEFLASEPQLEIGLTLDNRWRLAVRENDRALLERADWQLSRNDVVLITGGAYGVTAEVAKALAQRYRPKLVLVGRSALPDSEPAELQTLDVAGLRKHCIEQARQRGERLAPAEIEKQLKRLLRDRQIRETLGTIHAAGAEVEYHAVDVRDEQAMQTLLDDLYKRHGRIDGVIHGAGVIEDKLWADKSAESFARVFGTKVESVQILARRLQPETLKFFVLFSSVSGRLGNLGQSDYAAANEVLNKFAAAMRGRWIDGRAWSGRAVALNWGPWDAGMIGDELRKLYAAHGIGLIPLDEGVQACLDELRYRAPSEVILAAWPAEMVDALQGGFLQA